VSAARLTRAIGQRPGTARVRVAHLGLGNFFRAHQCWYTQHASDGPEWGIAGFTGRSGGPVVDDLNSQDGLYTLVTRAADTDRFEVQASLTHIHPGTDHSAWLGYFADPALAAVTITVTEAGYLRGADGGLDTTRPEVQADLATLRGDPGALVRTAPARLVAGLAARRAADAGPLALVPCDNIPGNGALAGRVVNDLARLIDPGLAGWITETVSVVSTMVDRITPRATPDDVRTVREATGVEDRCPVVTEPFTEWVLSGGFPAGRPRWQDAGARFTDDVTPFEHRKLWLLNGAHSLLAYAGSLRGHTTVAEAVDDPACRSWLQQWWSVASPHLPQPSADLAAYQDALVERFANVRMNDRLDRIAADGSQKLPIRILPVLRAERTAGNMPLGASRVLAAWICHLRGLGAPISDARADDVVPLAQGPLREAVPRVLNRLDRALGDDTHLIDTVVQQADELTGEAAASTH
jgi:fructuronate reductase